jgi:uncharacterized protein (TIGR02444 family)
MTPASAAENEFWRFSLAVYASPGVAAECLALQHSLDLDVNVLLFAAWLGWSRHVALSAQDLQGVAAEARPWSERVVKTLRAARRLIKDRPEAAVMALREKIRAAELDAERIEQDMLFAYAARLFPLTNSPEKSVVESNLMAFIQLHRGGGAERSAIQNLLSAVAALPPADAW